MFCFPWRRSKLAKKKRKNSLSYSKNTKTRSRSPSQHSPSPRSRSPSSLSASHRGIVARRTLTGIKSIETDEIGNHIGPPTPSSRRGSRKRSRLREIRFEDEHSVNGSLRRRGSIQLDTNLSPNEVIAKLYQQKQISEEDKNEYKKWLLEGSIWAVEVNPSIIKNRRRKSQFQRKVAEERKIEDEKFQRVVHDATLRREPIEVPLTKNIATKYRQKKAVTAIPLTQPLETLHGSAHCRGDHGDWLICPVGGGEINVVSETAFKKFYYKVPGTTDKYKPTGIVLAKQIFMPFAVLNKDGTLQKASSGHYLLQDGDDNRFALDKATFQQNYEKVDESSKSWASVQQMQLTEFTLASSFQLSSVGEIEHVSELSPSVAKILSKAGDWDFDIFQLEKATDGHAMYSLSMHLFEKYNLISEFGIDQEKLNAFIIQIESSYLTSNSYHNATHAADVLQGVNYFVQQTDSARKMDPLDLLGLLIAALAHDVAHPGTTNNFLINREDPLALCYNDTHVLENFHTAVCFQIMKDSRCNFVQGLTNSQYRRLRKTIIELILATDLASHFQAVRELDSRLSNTSNNPIVFVNDNDRILIFKTMVKCSDIANPTRLQPIHLKWARLIREEFFQQGDVEMKLGLPISSDMNRHETNIPKSQLGFMKFIAKPLFTKWTEFSNDRRLLTNLQENIDYWQLEQLNVIPDDSSDSDNPSVHGSLSRSTTTGIVKRGSYSMFPKSRTPPKTYIRQTSSFSIESPNSQQNGDKSWSPLPPYPRALSSPDIRASC